MSRTGSAREALLLEAMGDMASMVERLDALMPALDSSQQALVRASGELQTYSLAVERRVSNAAEQAQTQAIGNIGRCADEIARKAFDVHMKAMRATARHLLRDEVRLALQDVAVPLRVAANLTQRIGRPWDLWLTHAATAATASTLTWALMTWQRGG